MNFDGVEPRAPRVTRKERLAAARKVKKPKKRRDYMDADFDSELEYNSEVGSNDEFEEDGSDVEYDDGKGSQDNQSDDAEDAEGKLSDEDALNDDDESDENSDEYGDEEGENELSDMDESEEDLKSKAAIKGAKLENDYAFEKEDGEAADEGKQVKKDKKKKEEEVEQVFVDRYRMDPALVRRESTLLLLCLKAFKKRVIIFFNEKKQVGRLHSLFAFFGLKSVEVHGDLP